MFAVPGWSVSVKNLKVEKSLPELQSKKRKRPSQDGPPVDVDQIDELWKRHIDSRPANDQQNLKSKKERKWGNDQVEVQNQTAEGREVSAIEKSHGLHEAGQTNDKHQKRSYGEANTKLGVRSNVKASEQEVTRAGSTSTAKKRKKQKLGGNDERSATLHEPDSLSSNGVQALLPTIPTPILTPLQAKMRQKLISSRFRHLNETLYTNPSGYSLQLFKDNPGFFSEYHEGFRRQVEAWPEDPKESFLRWLRERGPVGMHNYKAIRRKTSRKHPTNGQVEDQDSASGPESLPRDPHKGLCTVADLGCGDGKLASDIINSSLQKKLKLKILSFDLAASAPHITVTDMKALPLEDSSIDIAIFCLALMGTNWIEFVEEAYRVLRWKGECWIAEVASRFAPARSKRVEHSVGNKVKDKRKPNHKQAKAGRENEEEFDLIDDDETPQHSTDVSAFVKVLSRRGFQLHGKPHTGNKMFVLMRFVKALPPQRGKCVKQDRREGKKKFIEEDDIDITVEEEGKLLKPCVYKLR